MRAIKGVVKATFTTIIVIFIVVAIYAAVAAIPVMLLWNWLMPEIFGLCKISIWQSFGILFLSGFLIRSGSAKTKSEN